MNKLEEEFRLALAEKYDERAHASKLMSKLRAEKTQESSKLQEAIAVRENALVESQRLQRELCELKQQLESTNATMQDQVS